MEAGNEGTGTAIRSLGLARDLDEGAIERRVAVGEVKGRAVRRVKGPRREGGLIRREEKGIGVRSR